MSIYDPVEVGSKLWIPSDALERLLQLRLAGQEFGVAALRTRSKLAKQLVCRALGYPIPERFARTRPRFLGPNFDTYVQGANNLQIWNEEISPVRRYVLIRPDANGVIQRVRVVSGADLAPLDTTGKLTQKYQARVADLETIKLASPNDSPNLDRVIGPSQKLPRDASPIDYPEPGSLMPIGRLFDLLKPLVGRSFDDPGILQERIRGGVLHGLVGAALGYRKHADNGNSPDIRHQLLEVKLQTSQTIDLGAISPDSGGFLDCPALGVTKVLYQDVRYAVCFGTISGKRVHLTGLVLVTGRDFFATFERCGGLVINAKYQLPLPREFFDRNTEGVFD